MCRVAPCAPRDQATFAPESADVRAWNNSDEPRAVLIFDIWNPDVSAEERAMVSMTIAGITEFYGFSQQRDIG